MKIKYNIKKCFPNSLIKNPMFRYIFIVKILNVDKIAYVIHYKPDKFTRALMYFKNQWKYLNLVN